MQICNRCVLDDKFPGISFDEDGVCNFCRSYKGIEAVHSYKEKYEGKFRRLLESTEKTNYDCLLSYSGGKDSTYTLYLLKKRYNLKILSLYYDNWFQSERSHQNIRNVLQNLNVDHMTVLPSFDIFKRIIDYVISNDIYPMKALERASVICTTCISLIRFMNIKVAIEKEIPFVVFGMSPGQAPIATSLFKTNADMIKKMQDTIFKPLHKQIGDDIKAFFLEERHFNKKACFPYIINPLAFSPYDEKDIIGTVQELGWRRPDDTDPNSSNCLLNCFANKIHIDRFGFNPYAYEIAELVRTGGIAREDGIARLAEQPSSELVDRVRAKLYL